MFEQLHLELLAELNVAGEIDWSRACVDAFHIRAKSGAATGPSPVDRDNTGSKRHYDHDKYRNLLRQRGIRPFSCRGTRDNDQHVR